MVLMKKLFEKMYKETADSFYDILKKNLKLDKKTFIVTANPETFMKSEKDEELNRLLNDPNTIIVPDGIGVVKTSKMIGYSTKERITGIDIAYKLLEFGNDMNKSLYLFGAKQEVLDALEGIIRRDYPNIKFLGSTNGYVSNKEKEFEKIVKLNPDIVMVALGIPYQEKLIYKYLNKFKKGIFIGVGGSFDVISGKKKRAPKIFIKLNIEWLYRIIREPKRIKRFLENNVKFLYNVKVAVNEKNNRTLS